MLGYDFPGVLQPEVCETTFSITPDIDVVVKVVNREPVVLLKPAYEANIQPSSVLLARDTTLATVTMAVYLELLPSSAAFTLPTDKQISTLHVVVSHSDSFGEIRMLYHVS